MRKPRAGRINIAQNLIKALTLTAPMNHGIEVVKALKAEEARTLRVVSTRLRKEASKLRAQITGLSVHPERAVPNALDNWADKFLHEAQALEKAHGQTKR